MNKNPKVSVVIPAYNTEPYIGDMLDSVARQTYDNMEVIVVNDGSTDGTLQKVSEYADKDSRFLVVDIPNGGVSNARNVGIQHCTGEKIFFWDSDDVVEPETIEQCVDFSIANHCNAVLYGYSNRSNNVNMPPHQTVMGGVKCCSNIVSEILPHFIGHSFDDVNNWIRGKASQRYGKEATALWHIMCDARTIKENNLQFDPKLSLGEDTIFINTYFLYEKSIGYLDKCFYHLAQREDGANLSSVLNAAKRIADKTKLIFARQEIDNKARRLCGKDTHPYWEGTLVFSGMEMALKMSHNRNMSCGENFSRYMDFMRIAAVREAYGKFRPAMGIKSLPFWLIKLCGPRIAFVLCYLLPDKIVGKFVK